MSIVAHIKDDIAETSRLQPLQHELHPALVAGHSEQPLSGHKPVHVRDQLQEDVLAGLVQRRAKGERGRRGIRLVTGLDHLVPRVGQAVAVAGAVVVEGAQTSLHGTKTSRDVPVKMQSGSSTI